MHIHICACKETPIFVYLYAISHADRLCIVIVARLASSGFLCTQRFQASAGGCGLSLRRCQGEGSPRVTQCATVPCSQALGSFLTAQVSRVMNKICSTLFSWNYCQLEHAGKSLLCLCLALVILWLRGVNRFPGVLFGHRLVPIDN